VITQRPAGAALTPFGDIACFIATDYDELATVAPSKVMAPVRIGSHILRYTLHSVVAAGFHRNNAGNLDAIDFFGGDEAAARAIAEKRSIDLVVDCGSANVVTLTEYEWLTALPGQGALSIYEVNLGE
jgi:hypothetical protein